MGFNKLQERGGSGTVTLDKGDLRLDGFVDEDGNVLEQEMHVQRVGEGVVSGSGSNQWRRIFDIPSTRVWRLIDYTSISQTLVLFSSYAYLTNI